jgi:hypothetical protein
MLRYTCGSCSGPVYFDNGSCLNCGARLALMPDLVRIGALSQDARGDWHEVGRTDENSYRPCANAADHAVCNGVVETASAGALCRACEFTVQIPALTGAMTLEYWRRLERAKRRLLCGLAQLGLPVESHSTRPAHALSFAFGADTAHDGHFVTGHAGGLISINVAEADDVEREIFRTAAGEPSRTLLGHFRHESGHYYLDHFARSTSAAWLINATFGDMRNDYDAALDAYHSRSAPIAADDRYISHYASAHPQEDWAETWAHYLLIVDTLQSAEQAGVAPRARAGTRARPRASDFDALVDRWLALAEFANEMARSLGNADAYPFVLTDPVVAKMRTIDRLVRGAR